MDKRIVLAGLIAACIGFAIYLLALRFVGLPHALATYADTLQVAYAEILKHNTSVILAAFVLLYTLVVALALPLTATMDLIGGAVLGLAGFPAALFSICFGSLVPFLIARRLGAAALHRFDTETISRVQRGFVRNGFQYLILLRLLPWAPCSMTTIISGALGMDLQQFLLGTGIGFIPAGLALNIIGRGLRRIGDVGDISIASLYRDSDFLLAALGVGIIVVLSLSRSLFSNRVPPMSGVGKQANRSATRPD